MKRLWQIIFKLAPRGTILRRWTFRQVLYLIKNNHDALWNIFNLLSPTEKGLRLMILERLNEMAITFGQCWAVWCQLNPESPLAQEILRKMIHLTDGADLLCPVLERISPGSRSEAIVHNRIQELKGILVARSLLAI